MTELLRAALAPGYSVAKIINGCWQLTPDHGGGPGSRREALYRFGELVEHGFTTFDCADIYEGTETLLGEFRRSFTDPDVIQIHTKLVPDRSRLAELDDKTIEAVVDRSLRRLDVDALDLVQFHWWDYDVPGLERLYERLLEIRGRGKIRQLGVTNFDTEHIAGLIERDPSLVTTQSQYSLLDRRPERRMTGLCQRSDVQLLAYGVLAGGFLAAAYLGEVEPPRMNRSLQKYRLIIEDAGGWSALQNLLAALNEIACKHETGLGSVAARWVLDQPAVAAIILGLGRRSRAEENRAILELELDEADRRKIGACLENLVVPAGEPYDLERNPESPHSRIIRTELQDPERLR